MTKRLAKKLQTLAMKSPAEADRAVRLAESFHDFGELTTDQLVSLRGVRLQVLQKHAPKTEEQLWAALQSSLPFFVRSHGLAGPHSALHQLVDLLKDMLTLSATGVDQVLGDGTTLTARMGRKLLPDLLRDTKQAVKAKQRERAARLKKA